MAGIARSGTAAWVPSGPTMRPFRFGDQHHPDPDPPIAAGVVVGDRYRVVGALGEGGMGRVYEAEHVFLGRRCALKLLRRDALRQPENVRRFQQEAMAASKIGHRAIVEVLDFATLPDGQVFMAMELLSGESLEAWMGRPGNLADVVPRLIEVADGLDAAHAAGVLHRDVKPANVFLARASDGSMHAKVLDFGIAKMTDRGANDLQTEAGSVLGTPYYLAPERAMGAAVDARADLYSLGVILYELLTGNVPFEADSFIEILGKHVKSQPLDPRQAAPERAIPDRIARLTMKLLSKDPADRPPTAGAVALELSHMLHNELPALRAMVTGPRLETSGSGEVTRVLTEVSGEHAPDTLLGAPMTAFAHRVQSGPASAVVPVDLAPPEPELDRDGGAPVPARSRGATAAVLLLVLFAVVGAAGGLIYLELAGGAGAASAAPRPAADEPESVARPQGTEREVEVEVEAPAPAPTPEEAAESGDEEPEKPLAPAGTVDAKNGPANGPASGAGKTTRPSRGGRPKHAKGGAAAEGDKPAPTPDPGPTIKDDIWEE